MASRQGPMTRRYLCKDVFQNTFNSFSLTDNPFGFKSSDVLEVVQRRAITSRDRRRRAGVADQSRTAREELTPTSLPPDRALTVALRLLRRGTAGTLHGRLLERMMPAVAMASAICPFCQQHLTDGLVGPAGCCPFCGKALPVRPPFVVRGVNIRLVAKRQRVLLWLILALLVMQFVPFIALQSGPIGAVVGVLLPILSLVALVFVVIGVVMMLVALQRHVVVIVLYAILMIAPCINLLVLLIVNSSATRAMRAAGLRVGFMGVKDEDIVRLLSPNLCRQCAYDLTGNVSGRCPECGLLIPRAEAIS
jgi:hypothetical protein